MTIARSIASPIARSIASPLDGAGGGGAPDPYGPELLANVEFAGYVAGAPGTAPTSWLDVQTTGSLAAPTLTFGAAVTRRAIYQIFTVTPGTFKLEVDATLNSGTAAIYDALFSISPAGTTVKYFVDDVELAGSTSWTGTKRLKIELIVINSGDIQFRCGAGVAGNRTQNVTITNPSLKKLVA